MVVVMVLGMHRSGTSCLTRMLQQAGMSLGNDLMNVVACSNLEGHAESWEGVRINDRILELSGGAWDRVPATLRADEDTANHIRAFLANLINGHAVVGWKDPRTTLTWPVWKPHLPAAYRLVACVRHPLAVAHSLQVRDGWPLEKGLDLWAAYNERLLEHVANEDGVCWFNFDLPETTLAGHVQALCRQLGLPSGEGVTEMFNPYLRHHVHAEPVPDPRLRALYERLLERAESQAPRPPGPAEAVDEVRLAKLAKVQRLQNELQQQQTRWLDEIRQLQVQFQNQLDHQQNSCQTTLQEQQNALQEIRRQQTWLLQSLQQQGTQLQLELQKQQTEIHQEIAAQHQQAHEAVARLEGLTHRLANGMASQIMALQTQNQELRAALSECQVFLQRLRSSLPFRCRRAVARCLRAVSAWLRRWFPSSAPAPSAPVLDSPVVRQAA
jgi:hypothetical protein